MSQDSEYVLKNALDAVDRGRRWTLIGVAALFVATTLALFALFHTAAGAPPSAQDGVSLKALYVTAASQMLLIAGCAAVVMMHVTRMTKSILRALEARR
jgi:hypothetical protein